MTDSIERLNNLKSDWLKAYMFNNQPKQVLNWNVLSSNIKITQPTEQF